MDGTDGVIKKVLRACDFCRDNVNHKKTLWQALLRRSRDAAAIPPSVSNSADEKTRHCDQ